MTLRGHYVTHLVLAVSLHSCLNRLKDHKAISSTKRVDLTNICPVALCARSTGRGHFRRSCQLAYPTSPQTRGFCLVLPRGGQGFWEVGWWGSNTQGILKSGGVSLGQQWVTIICEGRTLQCGRSRSDLNSASF